MSERILKGGEYLITEVTKEEVFTPEEFTDEQKQIGDTTEQFAINEVAPVKDDIEDKKFDVTVSLLQKAGELGLLMVDAPEKFGGLELDKVTSMLVAEKMSPAGGSFATAFSAHTGIGTLPLVYYGTDEQNKRYLEKIITGEWIGAYALTEPGSGSDALNAKMTAKLSEDGKHYILNGTKQFITNAGFANLFTVFAKIDGEHFTGFLVEKDHEGVSIGPEEKKMGIKGSSTTQLILENAKIPVENLLGVKGKGHKIAFDVLNVGRFKLGAAVMGASKNMIGIGAKYANERKQFGKTIGSFGAIKEKLANLTAETFASESLIYRLAGLLDKKIETIDKGVDDYYVQYQKAVEEYAPECAIAKVFCSDVLSRVADEVVQIHGGYGYIAEYEAERAYRDERINRLFEGTNEINRMLIPGMILRKSMKGELPLQAEAMKAFESLMSPSFEEIDDTIPFAKEKVLVKNLKTVFLILSAAAAQKFMDKLVDEQEILIAAADIAINIFALESALLRAEKGYEAASDKKKELLKAVVQSYAMIANEDAGKAARRGAFFTEEGDTLAMILSGIRRFTKFDATGLLASKRLLADATLEANKYVF